jgi:seryl-tRNA synthetase
MLDIHLIRDDTEAVKRGLAATGTATSIIDKILVLDAKRRAIQQEGDTLRAELNATSKKIGQQKDPGLRAELIDGVGELKNKVKAIASATPKIDAELSSLMLTVPNLPLAEVVVGQDESDNETVAISGEELSLKFTPRPHWEIMNDLGIIDFERGQKISGSRFYVLKGDGARLQRALISWMLDVHTMEHGYTEIYPPCMVRSDCLVGTGNLPKFGENLYRDAEEDYWFIPTAEVPITNLYRDEILAASDLPIKHVGYSPCFRREKMSHGKDTRGIKRGHQFDKVEMVQLVHPESSRAAIDQLTSHAARILDLLGLHYRTIKMCSADLSFVSCMKFDLESWAPGCQEWLEVSSCSLFGDFQARRAKIRFKNDSGKNEFVHTLNGSGLALPRVMISIIESYQQEDGSVVIPDILVSYMGGRTRIEKQ